MSTNETAAQSFCALCLLSLLSLVFKYFAFDTPSIYSHIRNTSPALIQAAAPTVPGSDVGAPEVIRIVYVNSAYLERDWGLGEGSAPLSACPNMASRCEFTTNMSLVNDSDALLFFMPNRFAIPAFRQKHQKWIFANYESPVHTYVNLKSFENMFNLTMTYVHPAENDIDWSYGRCLRITEDDQRFQPELASGARLNGSADNRSPAYANYAHGKKHLAAGFVTNCRAKSHREMYVNQMRRYADIHVYGCGPYKCSILNATFCDEELLNNDYKLRRFALAYIHSHSGATGVFWLICRGVYFRFGAKKKWQMHVANSNFAGWKCRN